MKNYQLIILSMIFGVLAGLFFPAIKIVTEPIGLIFIQLLKALIAPLIFTSLTTGMCSLGSISQFGKLGSKTFLYFALTTILSASLGLLCLNIFKIGSTLSESFLATKESLSITTQSFSEILLGMFPDNFLGTFIGSNYLPLIFVSIFFGLALLKTQPKNKTLLNGLESLNNMFMLLVEWVIALSPIAIFALIATLISNTGLEMLLPLLKYLVLIASALAIYALIILPLILWLFTKKSALAIFKKLSTALMIAFSTASSAATLPVALKSIQESCHVSKNTSSFVFPLGITINMDGTALYQAATVAFLAQVYGVSLSLPILIVIVLTTLLASIAAAAIPSAGLITLTMILSVAGVPLEGIAIILAVDRILDMLRTTVNIWGNSIACLVLDTRILDTPILDTSTSKP